MTARYFFGFLIHVLAKVAKIKVSDKQINKNIILRQTTHKTKQMTKQNHQSLQECSLLQSSSCVHPTKFYLLF